MENENTENNENQEENNQEHSNSENTSSSEPTPAPTPEPAPQAAPSNSNSGGELDNTIGILAYCTLIGFIIGIVLNGSKEGEEKKFGAFHLRQALGLIIVAVGAYIANMIITMIIMSISWKLASIVLMFSGVIGLGVLGLVIMGIVNAVNKTKEPLPVIGEPFNKMLGTTFE
jgi:uncharacterized membrane protein